jgi:hypothetical protein
MLRCVVPVIWASVAARVMEDGEGMGQKALLVLVMLEARRRRERECRVMLLLTEMLCSVDCWPVAFVDSAGFLFHYKKYEYKYVHFVTTFFKECS